MIKWGKKLEVSLLLFACTLSRDCTFGIKTVQATFSIDRQEAQGRLSRSFFYSYRFRCVEVDL
ncbi:hypothetical protein CSUI_006311 [Cystoisospora suis]|uniref:Secreted protein n=1 Tax=Cystoisospora suis TaxID=483139 RepID=A0A2C6KUJ1_9APIC|nr:hypothetical protein CSUI_006311 [Cystoisospora suis]